MAAFSAPWEIIAKISRLAGGRPGQIFRLRRKLERVDDAVVQVRVQADPAPVAVAGTAVTVEFEGAIV